MSETRPGAHRPLSVSPKELPRWSKAMTQFKCAAAAGGCGVGARGCSQLRLPTACLSTCVPSTACRGLPQFSSRLKTGRHYLSWQAPLAAARSAGVPAEGGGCPHPRLRPRRARAPTLAAACWRDRAPRQPPKHGVPPLLRARRPAHQRRPQELQERYQVEGAWPSPRGQRARAAWAGQKLGAQPRGER